MTDDRRRLINLVELIESELHQSQRQQQGLINALTKAKAELEALDGTIVYLDGERLIRD